MPQSAAARAATAERRLRCVQLAREGKTYEQIAAEVGFANKSSARKAVVTAEPHPGSPGPSRTRREPGGPGVGA